MGSSDQLRYMGSSDRRKCDAIIVVPPFSPSDSNPPLGPAILARRCCDVGVSMGVVDLNIQMMTDEARLAGDQSTNTVIGDHGKDERVVAHFESKVRGAIAMALNGEMPQFLPNAGDPIFGLHFSLRAVERVAQALNMVSWWVDAVDRYLFKEFEEPSIVGISIMGPGQIWCGVALARLVKTRWPRTRLLVGGTHITLLMESGGIDALTTVFGGTVERFFRGHAEADLAMAASDTPGELVWIQRKRIAAGTVSQRGEPGFPYWPEFGGYALDCYRGLTFPVQFTRGCAYGKCAYCTYPAVEPDTSVLFVRAAGGAVQHLVHEWGARRVSVKDSLVTIPMLLALCREFRRRGLPIEWSATSKLSRRFVTSAEEFSIAGLRTIEFGLESIHPRVQRFYDKVADIRMVEDVVRALTEAGIAVVLNMIFGAPVETIRDAKEQIDWFNGLRSSLSVPSNLYAETNMLEIERLSPLSTGAVKGVDLHGIAPLAQAYDWSAPDWRIPFVEWLNGDGRVSVGASSFGSAQRT
jgi:hypothetical protein